MEKIKNLSLRKTIIVYIGIALLVSFFSSAGIMKAAYNIQQNVWKSYLTELELEKGYGNILEIPRVSNYEMSDMDTQVSEICDFLETWTVLLLSMAGCVAAVILFYQHKISEPLRQLDYGSKMIAQNELDFSVDYQNKDEMGRLCTEFERMRKQLKDNNLKMWGMVEKEKAVRATIAHDIRTPLSTLKGYQEMLLEFIPEDKLGREKLLEILKDGMGQIDRLTEFVETMRQLSGLEERQVNGVKITQKELEAQLSQTATIMGKEFRKQYEFHGFEKAEARIVVDTTIIYEVYENLLSNAFRYAKQKVDIAVSREEDMLKITLIDDGKGFTEDMEKVTKAYFHANPTDDLQHFGLGLYISRIYCEKHGGKLLLGNTEKSGAYAKARFRVVQNIQ